MRRSSSFHRIAYPAVLAACALFAACGGRAVSLGEGAPRPAGATGGHAGATGGHAGATGGHAGAAGGSRDAGAGAAGQGTGGYLGGAGGGYVPETGGGGSGGDGSGGWSYTGGFADTGGTGGSAEPPSWLPEGFYDVRLHDVQLAYAQGSPSASEAGPLSEGLYLRIDYDPLAEFAVVTPRWGDSSPFVLSFEGDDIVLHDGNASIVTTTPSGYIDEGWETIRLTRSNVPGEAASAQIQVFRLIFENDNDSAVASGKGPAKGDVTFDDLAPEMRSELTAGVTGSSDARLPWDPLRFRSSEGVATPLAPAMSATIVATGPTVDTGLAGSLVPVTWTEGDDNYSEGMLWVEGKAASWEALPGSSVTVKADRRGVVDLSNHVMATDLMIQVKYLDVNRTVDKYTFDAGGPVPGQWGTVTFYGQAGSDPHCASGGCIQLGPFDNGVCNVPRIGIAGRLRRKNGPLLVQYHILSADAPGGGPPYVFDQPPSFAVQTADDSAMMDTDIAVSAYRNLGAAAGELHWTSGDELAEIEIPQGDMYEVGFAIYAGNSASIACAGATPGGGTKTAVVIDRVGF